MAGAGRRTFQPGEVLTASNVNSYLMDQSVMRFADSAARGSAVGTAVIAEGMVSYLDDTNAIQFYDGSAWQFANNLPIVADSTARSALFPSPTEGNVVYQSDRKTVYLYDGTSWIPSFRNVTAYTATWGNATLTTSNAWFSIRNGVMSLQGRGIFSAMGSDPYVEIPPGYEFDRNFFSTTSTAYSIGDCLLFDVGVTNYAATARTSNVNDNRIVFNSFDAVSSYVRMSGITATVPFTWGSGDIISFNCTFPIVEV